MADITLRSGIFLADSSAAQIRDNRIGVAAASDDAIGNGASGIYVGDHGTAIIEHNVIANSLDFGVAVNVPPVRRLRTARDSSRVCSIVPPVDRHRQDEARPPALHDSSLNAA